MGLSADTNAPICDLACIKAASKEQNADAVISSDNLKFWMDVTYSDPNPDSGSACGWNHTFDPVPAFRVNPSAPTKVTTEQTRQEPVVTFECTPDKMYHLVMQDSLNGEMQNHSGYTHWVKINLDCGSDQQGSTSQSGTNINQGVPGTVGYLAPAFPFNQLQHFHFAIFETAAALNATAYNEFMTTNQLDSGIRLPQHMAEFSLGLPVARSWIDVTTSYWSKVRIDRIAPGGIPGFSDLMCACNRYESLGQENCTAMKLYLTDSLPDPGCTAAAPTAIPTTAVPTTAAALIQVPSAALLLISGAVAAFL